MSLLLVFAGKLESALGSPSSFAGTAAKSKGQAACGPATSMVVVLSIAVMVTPFGLHRRVHTLVRQITYAGTVSDWVNAFDMTLIGAGWPVQSSKASAP